MHKGKQVTKKPQNKVGVPQKKGRSEEGKGGEPAVPCKERLEPGRCRHRSSPKSNSKFSIV